ncbi:MAG: hypothetical protein QM652_10035 [Legionella sp.]|uniref:hypothetical protein n=1 Tax=Legionella sp. TaxID=459 RepID=UPI0039E28C0D
MHQQLYEIVILKPTAVFLSFLAAHLPETKLPELRLLQIDNTAYVIPKCNSDNETLDEIEKHFTTMFRHEISRWLGDRTRSKIETSYFDFLCCFKLEFHNHIILLESVIKQAKQLLLLKPRMPLLNWLKSMVEDEEELADVVEHVQLANLQENATALVKNFSNLTEIKPFIQEYYYPIFKSAMSRITSQATQWPKINSLQEFKEYFAIEIHTQLIHLYQ